MFFSILGGDEDGFLLTDVDIVDCIEDIVRDVAKDSFKLLRFGCAFMLFTLLLITLSFYLVGKVTSDCFEFCWHDLVDFEVLCVVDLYGRRQCG